jgi:hypothetical protein
VGRVTEIWHFDSAQCWRTFDPDFPVIYQNPRDNTFKRLHKTRVIMLSPATRSPTSAGGLSAIVLLVVRSA